MPTNGKLRDRKRQPTISIRVRRKSYDRVLAHVLKRAAHGESVNITDFASRALDAATETPPCKYKGKMLTP